MTRTDVVVNEPNRWRLATPGHAGWSRTARQYFMVSADCSTKGSCILPAPNSSPTTFIPSSRKTLMMSSAAWL